MPGSSGLEVLLQLRALRYWTPIFLTSARDDFPTVVEAMKTGGHDFIRKPFDRGTLAARLHNAIESWPRRGQNYGLADHQMDENCEWFRLTPSEKEMILLMRMVNS